MTVWDGNPGVLQLLGYLRLACMGAQLRQDQLLEDVAAGRQQRLAERKRARIGIAGVLGFMCPFD